MKFDSYIRVSRVAGREGESFISPDLQRDQIQAWARMRGVEISAWHEDLDQTGGKLSRPGLDALIARIRSGQTDGIVVARLDRLSRAGVADALALVEEIHRHGGKVSAVDLGIDPTTTFGEFALTIMLALARMERRRITENWDAASERAIARGVHMTNVPPFGYRRGNGGRLEPDSETAPIVAEVFRRRALRHSRPKIAAWLNEVAPRDNGRTWSARNIATMVENRAYLGEAFRGAHRNLSAHPALVTLPDFEAANAVKGGPGAIAKKSALLSGVIRCAGCRYAMRKTWTSYAHGRRELYVCTPSTTKAGGKCKAPAKIMAHLVEPVVLTSVLAIVGDAQWSDPTEDGKGVDDARCALLDAEARLAAFLADDELRAIVGRDEFLRSAQDRRAAVDAAKRDLGAAQSSAHAADRRTHVLLAEWDGMTIEERAETLRMVLDTVYVKKGRGSVEDRVMVVWDGEDDFEKPSRGTTTYRSQPIPWPEDPATLPSAAWPGWRVPGLARRTVDRLVPDRISPEQLRAVAQEHDLEFAGSVTPAGGQSRVLETCEGSVA